jgi:hypothetical protein
LILLLILLIGLISLVSLIRPVGPLVCKLPVKSNRPIDLVDPRRERYKRIRIRLSFRL